MRFTFLTIKEKYLKHFSLLAVLMPIMLLLLSCNSNPMKKIDSNPGLDVKSLGDLSNPEMFDIRISLHNYKYLTYPSIEIKWTEDLNYEYIDLYIDETRIDLYEDFELPYTLLINFDFSFGGTYQFKLITKSDELITERIINFTFSQPMNINWPDSIDNEQNHLSWRLYPNNNKNNDFTEFSISKLILPKIDEVSFILSPTSRKHTFSGNALQSLNDGTVILGFEVANYVTSERISILARDIYSNHSAVYKNGKLQIDE